MKTCFKCKRSLPRESFYRHPEMADGLLGKCKDCAKADVARRAVEKHDEIAEYDRSRAMVPHRVAARRQYIRTEAGKAAKKVADQNYQEKYPEKYKAHNVLSGALLLGKIIRQSCEVCGDVKSEAHHPDYSKPLEVKWLCNKHHRAEHKKKAA